MKKGTITIPKAFEFSARRRASQIEGAHLIVHGREMRVLQQRRKLKGEGYIRRLSLILCSTLCLPLMSHALGLGPIKIHSALDEPMKAEIRLINVGDASLDNVQVSLASAEQFKLMGMDRPGELSNLQFTVQKNAKKQPIIFISSSEKMSAPILKFLLDVHWSGGEYFRSYTILLDPPTYSQTAPLDTSKNAAAVGGSVPLLTLPAAPKIPSRQPSGAGAKVVEPQGKGKRPPSREELLKRNISQSEPTMPVVPATEFPSTGTAPATPTRSSSAPSPSAQSSSAVQPLPAPTPITSAPTAVPQAIYGPVKEDQSLWMLAHQIKPSNADVTINQTMVSILQANPNAFHHHNINELKRGATLKIPSAAEILQTTPDLAAKEVIQQDKHWQHHEDGSLSSTQLDADATKTSSFVKPQARSFEQPAANDKSASNKNAASSVPELRLKDLKTSIEQNPLFQTLTQEKGTAPSETLKAELAVSAEAVNSVKQANANLSQELTTLHEENNELKTQLSLQREELTALKNVLGTLTKKPGNGALQTATTDQVQGVSSQGQAANSYQAESIFEKFVLIILALLAASAAFYYYWARHRNRLIPIFSFKGAGTRKAENDTQELLQNTAGRDEIIEKHQPEVLEKARDLFDAGCFREAKDTLENTFEEHWNKQAQLLYLEVLSCLGEKERFSIVKASLPEELMNSPEVLQHIAVWELRFKKTNPMEGQVRSGSTTTLQNEDAFSHTYGDHNEQPQSTTTKKDDSAYLIEFESSYATPAKKKPSSGSQDSKQGNEPVKHSGGDNEQQFGATPSPDHELNIESPAPDFSGGTETGSDGSAQPAVNIDLQTKYELAVAYRAMGDREETQRLLTEIIAKGDPELAAKAQQLLNELDAEK